MLNNKDNVKVTTLLEPNVYSADNTPAAAEIGDHRNATILVFIGVGGITFDTTNKLELKLSESEDNSSYTAVGRADVSGVTVGDGGVIKSLTAAHAAAETMKLGYLGRKPYLKLLADFSGTHGTGTPLAAVVMSEPYKLPV